MYNTIISDCSQTCWEDITVVNKQFILTKRSGELYKSTNGHEWIQISDVEAFHMAMSVSTIKNIATLERKLVETPCYRVFKRIKLKTIIKRLQDK